MPCQVRAPLGAAYDPDHACKHHGARWELSDCRDEAGFVHDLLVTETARHTGVGQRLLDSAIGWLREQGMPRVVLWTATPNDSARRLFEGRGFRSTMVEMTLELD